MPLTDPDPVVGDAPEAAASSWEVGGGVGGTMLWSFQVPYWGLMETSDRWAKAMISLATRLELAVDCCSCWITSERTSASDACVWLVTS